MSSFGKFEQQLAQLDPAAIDFVLRVDQLVEAVPKSANNEELIGAIFSFFEAHPLDDMGAPGTLVHLVEEFYPRYTERLLDSLRTRPSYNAILMTNRILNGQLSDGERFKYMPRWRLRRRRQTFRRCCGTWLTGSWNGAVI